MRPITELEKEMFEYLNELQESGVTNMFGALSYLQRAFPDHDKTTCRTNLSLWMINYKEDGIYTEIF